MYFIFYYLFIFFIYVLYLTHGTYWLTPKGSHKIQNHGKWNEQDTQPPASLLVLHPAHLSWKIATTLVWEKQIWLCQKDKAAFIIALQTLLETVFKATFLAWDGYSSSAQPFMFIASILILSTY